MTVLRCEQRFKLDGFICLWTLCNENKFYKPHFPLETTQMTMFSATVWSEQGYSTA